MMPAFLQTLSARRSDAVETPSLKLGPIVALCIAIAVAALPLPLSAETAPPWTYAVLILAALARCLMLARGISPPGLPLRLVLLVAGLTSIYVQFGKFLGIEPGFGVLLILLAMKLLETRTTRDFHVMVLLGYFISLCVLFFAQDLPNMLLVVGNLVLVTAAAVRWRTEGLPRPMWPALRTASVLLLQSIPVVVMLFFFFPRFRGEFRLYLGQGLMGSTGFSERISPGGVSGLARRTEVAFRVAFPDGNVPPVDKRYWRAIVFWQGQGLDWERGSSKREPERMILKPQQPTFRQQISLEPYGNRYLFALDYPVRTWPQAELLTGGVYRSFQDFFTRYKYEVVSSTAPRGGQLPPGHQRDALQLPAQVSPELRKLAAELQAGTETSRQIVDRTLAYFRRGGFTYTLDPGTYDSGSIDEFLFRRRTGFCEHFAGAFATLMRLSGVPARLVGGYLGGEFSPLGDYLIVRQSDAHAWCEVWLPEDGWTRVDPTSVIAPMRINLSLQNYFEQENANSNSFAQRFPVGYVWRNAFQQARLVWDNMAYQWDRYVLSYDEERQRALLMNWGMGKWSIPQLLFAVMAVVVAFLGGIVLWLRRPQWRRAARSSEEKLQLAALRWYARFCRKAARGGVVRTPAEGPLAYTQRVAMSFPTFAAQILEIGRIYMAIRYSQAPQPLGALAQTVRQLPRLQAARKNVTSPSQ